jgi:hypothetical protein
VPLSGNHVFRRRIAIARHDHRQVIVGGAVAGLSEESPAMIMTGCLGLRGQPS